MNTDSVAGGSGRQYFGPARPGTQQPRQELRKLPSTTDTEYDSEPSGRSLFSRKVLIPIMALTLVGVHYLASLTGTVANSDHQDTALTNPLLPLPQVTPAPTSTSASLPESIISTVIGSANLILLSALGLCTLILCCTCVRMKQYKDRLENLLLEDQPVPVPLPVQKTDPGVQRRALITPIAGVLNSAKQLFPQEQSYYTQVRPRGINRDDDLFFAQEARNSARVQQRRLNDWQAPVPEPVPANKKAAQQPVTNQPADATDAPELEGFAACLPTVKKQHEWQSLSARTRMSVYQILPEHMIYTPGTLPSPAQVQRLEHQRVMAQRQDFYNNPSRFSLRTPPGLFKQSVYEKFGGCRGRNRSTQ